MFFFRLSPSGGPKEINLSTVRVCVWVGGCFERVQTTMDGGLGKGTGSTGKGTGSRGKGTRVVVGVKRVGREKSDRGWAKEGSALGKR